MGNEQITAMTTTKHQEGVLVKTAQRFGVDPTRILDILALTAFKVKDKLPTKEQMLALMIVADQFNLNPFTREIYAFPGKDGGIVPIVGIDGWNRIRVESNKIRSMTIQFGGEMISIGGSKKCYEWVDVAMLPEGYNEPVTVREYFEECHRDTEPWKNMPKRMLRHKGVIQCTRLALGFGGIYDEDEGRDILAGSTQVIDVQSEKSAAPSLSAKLDQRRAAIEAPKGQPPAPAPAPDPAAVQAAAKAKEKDKAAEYKRGRGRPPAARQEAPPLNDVGTPPEQPDLLGGRESGDDEEEWPETPPQKE